MVGLFGTFQGRAAPLWPPLCSCMITKLLKIKIPETDRPIYPGEKDGLHFNFILREKMDELLRRDDLLDFRQHNSYRYGTTFAAIRKVMAHNKLCIVNCCNPEVIQNHILPKMTSDSVNN